jgi:hypothetical protein
LAVGVAYNSLSIERSVCMIHVVKLIQRRYPNSSGRIIGSLFALSASALAIGIGLMLLNQR